MPERLHRLLRTLVQMARLMVGVPDYQAYLARRGQYPSSRPAMSQAEFVRYCSERRLGGRGPGRCC